jgi:hypothetical protein
MIELALIILGGIVLLTILQVVGKQLWLTFKWRVLGWKPRILDEKLVTETVEAVTKMALKNDVADARQAGHEFTQEELDAHASRVKTFGRNVIELYIELFTRRC